MDGSGPPCATQAPPSAHATRTTNNEADEEGTQRDGLGAISHGVRTVRSPTTPRPAPALRIGFVGVQSRALGTRAPPHHRPLEAFGRMRTPALRRPRPPGANVWRALPQFPFVRPLAHGTQAIRCTSDPKTVQCSDASDGTLQTITEHPPRRVQQRHHRSCDNFTASSRRGTTTTIRPRSGRPTTAVNKPVLRRGRLSYMQRPQAGGHEWCASVR